MHQRDLRARRGVQLAPAQGPFQDRTRLAEVVDEGALPGDLMERRVAVRAVEEVQVLARRHDGVDARHLAADALDQRFPVAAQALVLDHAVAERHAVQLAHQIEGTPEHFGVGAEPQRLGHADPGVPGGLDHRELLRAVQADGDRRGRVGAQHHRVPPFPGPVGEDQVDQPVLLDGAAGQRLGLLDLGAAGVGGLAQEVLQPRLAFAQLHVQKSRPSAIRLRASTILCTSEAPSTRRACRA